jgi:hypothetical protein
MKLSRKKECAEGSLVDGPGERVWEVQLYLIAWSTTGETGGTTITGRRQVSAISDNEKFLSVSPFAHWNKAVNVMPTALRC